MFKNLFRRRKKPLAIPPARNCVPPYRRAEGCPPDWITIEDTIEAERLFNLNEKLLRERKETHDWMKEGF